VFGDCAGDGGVRDDAGAQYRFGRESRDEFGESAAPERADRITMSGCIMGNYALGYRAVDTGQPQAYAPPPWATRLPPPEAFHRFPKGFAGGQWWLEHPGDIDDLEDPEHARDELIRISFAYWGWIKNHWEHKTRARTYALSYVPYMDARRETRRLVGDYILKQQDAEQGVMFPDRISYGGWSLDVHNPRGIHSGKEGPYDFDGRVPIYSIPYRTLYSTNIVNLLFAGRCMSVTHIALGTVRVEARSRPPDRRRAPPPRWRSGTAPRRAKSDSATSASCNSSCSRTTSTSRNSRTRTRPTSRAARRSPRPARSASPNSRASR